LSTAGTEQRTTFAISPLGRSGSRRISNSISASARSFARSSRVAPAGAVSFAASAAIARRHWRQWALSPRRVHPAGGLRSKPGIQLIVTAQRSQHHSARVVFRVGVAVADMDVRTPWVSDIQEEEEVLRSGVRPAGRAAVWNSSGARQATRLGEDIKNTSS
jgi:hypothetical protein